MHAIVGWELELIAPKLCEIIGMKYGERTDEEGYTSEWLLELDKWLAESGLQSLGIWTDGDTMFGTLGSYFIGYYVSEDHMDDWVSNISIQMNKFKEICTLNKMELEEPKMHHRDDAGFGYACDWEFKVRLTPKQLEEQEEKNRIESAAKLNRGIEKLQDKTDDERHWVIHQLPFQENPEIYSLSKELLREPDEGFWLQLANGITFGLGMDFIGKLLPEMIYGLKSKSETVRQCSKLYLSEYITPLPNNNEDYIYVKAGLENFEINALKDILKLDFPSQNNIYASYYEDALETINKLISKIIDKA